MTTRSGANAPRPQPRTSPGRKAGVIVSLALVLSATSLIDVSDKAEAASTEPETHVQEGWLASLAAWLAPISSWTDATAVSARVPADVPSVTTIRLQPRPKRGAFSMNLYGSGDFVSQQTVYWCVAASVQTMMNIIDDGKPRRSKKLQRKLHFQARRLDQDDDEFWRRTHGSVRWSQGLHGLGLSDWADMLTTTGYGPYEVERAPRLKHAVRKAAKALRTTGRPVGLVVWRGAHAWVMSGFTATADPALTDDFKIKKVFVHDPWYPMVSSIWGHSRPPNAAVTLKQLGQDYLRYNRPRRRHPMRDGKYMLVMPTLAAGTQVR